MTTSPATIDSAPDGSATDGRDDDPAPLLATAVLLTLWSVLSVRSPTTTYHAAPLIAAAAGAIVARWKADGPLLPRAAIVRSSVGLGVTLLTIAELAYLDALRGPALWGADQAAAESVLLAVVGAVWGARFASRARNRWLDG